MNTLIKNGRIVDGSGQPAYDGNLIIKGDTIISITKDLPSCEFDCVIDARGHIVSPGFIDTHSHSDLEALLYPHIEPKLRQGITTELLGQDGISMAPLPSRYISDWRKNIGGLEGDSDSVDWHQLESTDQYLNMLEKRKPCTNFAYLVPHGNIRLKVMGFSNEPASDRELREMEAVLAEEMGEGAFGLSTGLVYVPCVYAKTEELIRLCKIVARYNGTFVVHQRYESDRIIESVSELCDIVRKSGVHLHISHFKITARRNSEKRYQVFKLIDDLKTEGFNFTADQYPYIAGSTMLGRVIPPWAHVGGISKLMERLADGKNRQLIKEDILHTTSVWDNMISVCTQDGIIITSVTKPQNQKFVGHSIVEIGEMTGKDALDSMMDLLLDEENKVGMICKNGVEEVMRDIMLRNDVNVCTDGLLGGTPHPRVYGAFPRVIGRYVRKEHILTLENAVRKMTSQAAHAFGFTDLGILKEGKKADIVIFDYDTIIDVGDYSNPRRFAAGIDTVLVNGDIVLQNGKVNSDQASGRILRMKR